MHDRRHSGQRDPQEHALDEAGAVYVPNTLLKIWTQALPHCVVEALAGTVPVVLSPPATVSAAAAASTLVLMDMTFPFFDDGRALRTALLCWSR